MGSEHRAAVSLIAEPGDCSILVCRLSAGSKRRAVEERNLGRGGAEELPAAGAGTVREIPPPHFPILKAVHN
jgi:hypothetical protein